MSKLMDIVLANFFVSVLSFSGAAVLVWQKRARDEVAIFLVSFAAGVMLAAAFFDLLPEALGQMDLPDGPIFGSVAAGIVVFFFLERFVLWYHHHHKSHGVSPAPILILVGDGVHNFIDGLAIAATFIVNPGLGLITTLAIAAHEIPQEIADFSVLVYGGLAKKTALFLNFLSGLTAVFGGIVGFYFLERLGNFVPIFLAFTAGMFIYISCADLIPELHRDYEKKPNWLQPLFFLFGIFVLWGMAKVIEG